MRSFRYLDPLWGAVSGAIAFKLAQDRKLPPEKHLLALLKRGWASKQTEPSLPKEDEDEAMAEISRAIASEQKQ